MTSSSNPIPDRFKRTVGSGLVAGTLAYMLGFLIVYEWRITFGERDLFEFERVIKTVGELSVPSWQSSGWLFYNSHFVATRASSLSHNPIVQNLIETSGKRSIMALYLVPPLLLVLAGFLVNWLNNTNNSLSWAAVSGVTVAIPYALLSVQGAILFRYGPSISDLTISPDLVAAGWLAGVIYPTIFGTIGGFLAIYFTRSGR